MTQKTANGCSGEHRAHQAARAKHLTFSLNLFSISAKRCSWPLHKTNVASRNRRTQPDATCTNGGAGMKRTNKMKSPNARKIDSFQWSGGEYRMNGQNTHEMWCVRVARRGAHDYWLQRVCFRMLSKHRTDMDLTTVVAANLEYSKNFINFVVKCGFAVAKDRTEMRRWKGRPTKSK